MLCMFEKFILPSSRVKDCIVLFSIETFLTLSSSNDIQPPKYRVLNNSENKLTYLKSSLTSQ